MNGRKKPRQPKPVLINAMAFVSENAAVLSVENRHNILQTIEASRAALLRQDQPLDQWLLLAGVLNTAESLSSMGICSDEASRGKLESGHEVLSNLWLRAVEHGGSWTLPTSEIARLDAALEVHRIQLRYCSLGEYDRARALVAKLAQQYRSGNAPKGAQVMGVGVGAMGRA